MTNGEFIIQAGMQMLRGYRFYPIAGALPAVKSPGTAGDPLPHYVPFFAVPGTVRKAFLDLRERFEWNPDTGLPRGWQ